jgi:hypothetical protein
MRPGLKFPFEFDGQEAGDFQGLSRSQGMHEAWAQVSLGFRPTFVLFTPRTYKPRVGLKSTLSLAV